MRPGRSRGGGSRHGLRLAAALVVAAAWWAAGALPIAVVPAAAQDSPRARVILRPSVARLGERVGYRAEVIGWAYTRVRWLAPDSGAALTWGEPRTGYNRGRPRERRRFGSEARTPKIDGVTPDTTWIELPLQVFEIGIVPIPGVRFEYRDINDPVSQRGQAPSTRLVVLPVLTPADSQATLRPVHGPLAAPWWERVPWRVLLAALALLAVVTALTVWLRRRRRTAVAPATEPAPNPVAAALAALAALRALHLAEQGRFAEHAFRLGQILRRYLEATVRTTRPGDTTPELVRHLQDAGLEADALRRLAGLLRAWDRVKFARETLTVEEALRSETAVEAFLRRAPAAEPQPKVA